MRDSDTVKRFLEVLFKPGELLCLAVDGADRRQSLSVESAIKLLSQNPDAPNVYFSACVHNGAADYTRPAFTYTRAILLDIDYGKVGHNKVSPFATREDATSYLLTVPIQPSIAWHTGHGIQVAYLLRDPYLFDGDTALEQYEQVAQGLKQMLLADAHQTPERLFRVPCTVNQKPDAPAIRGELLWFHAELKYSVSELTSALDQLDLPPAPPVPVVTDDEDAGKDATFEQLPGKLQADILAAHDDRSAALFVVILKMLGANYSEQTIRNAVARGPDFATKYGKRLQAEVGKIILKIRKGGVSSYRPYTAPLQVKVKTTPISLADCAPLPEAIRAKLDQYAAVVGVELQQRVYESAQLHEHLFATHSTGVVEVPCGYGKTTWAICHIAANATPNKRYILVVETIDAIHRHADVLDKLTEIPVGRVHSFNPKQCTALCGKLHTYQECNAWNHRSACLTCEARTKCHYHNRDAEERKPIQVMTHAGFIRMLEEDDELLEDANIIIDEHLSHFLSADLDKEKLALANRLLADANCKAIPELFPCSSLCDVPRSHASLKTNNTTYAAKNILFVGEAKLKQLARYRDEIRKRLSTLNTNPFKQAPAETARARDILFEVMQLLRLGDASSLAYHETDISIVVKKRRFSLKTQRTYKSLWILNASASLATEEYPDNLPVFRCTDFQARNIGAGITLHVASENPFLNKLEMAIRVTAMVVTLGGMKGQHKKALIVTHKDGTGKEKVEELLESKVDPSVLLPGIEIVHLTRGYLRGTNQAGNCTLGIFSCLPLFTTIWDVGLFVALHFQKSFPLVPHLIN